ncbi:MAG: serine/threonine protein phosphatase [Verrucomicrobiales bacterium]|nr:serine/threonine protein phosphatase [Verrucomicrobiales bacterium]
MSNRLLAIGDIHGCLTALEKLAEGVGFSKSDHLVFLGDYVDRGPDTKGVIDFLIGLRDEGYNVTFLRGNHEIMMLGAVGRSGDSLISWLGVGGDEAMESYNADSFDDVPTAHWDFLRNDLQPWHETENHIFVHAGASPDIEMHDQSDFVLYWEFFDFPEPHQSGKTVICGHSSQRNGRPLSVGHAVCIDTFAYGDGGWLTCLDPNAQTCWRANQAGQFREELLEEIANEESVR